MQNTIDYWTFIRTFDISQLEDSFVNLVLRSKEIFNATANSKHDIYKSEIINYENLIDYQIIETDKVLRQLVPVESKIVKRGLINGLGSIFKAITGNLDYEDAQKYEAAILELRKSQFKTKTLVEQQLTLTENAIAKFNNTVSKVVTNQVEIENEVNYIVYRMEQEQHDINKLEVVLVLQMLLNQIITAIATVRNILETLVNAVTFAKLQTLHPSIIESQDLLDELKKLENLKDKPKLPYEINSHTVQLYEKIADLKCYYQNKNLIFVIEIPIVDSLPYNYYHLYSLPMKKSSEFQVVIPNNKYLSINEKYFSLSNIPCKEVSPKEYLCKTQYTHEISNSSPCEVQLLRYTNHYETCEINKVQLSREKIQKISEDQWIAVFPNETVINKKCGKNRETSALQGSYVIRIPEGCQIRIRRKILKTYQDSLNPVEHVKIPSIQVPDLQIKREQEKFVPLQLETINLDELSPLIHQIQHTRKELGEIEIPQFHTATSVWTIILYVILFIFVVIMCIKWKAKFRKYLYKVNNRNNNEPVAFNNEIRL